MSLVLSSSAPHVLQPGIGCVSLCNGGLTDSGCVFDDEEAVVAVDVVPRSADEGPAKLPESGLSGGTQVIFFGGKRSLAAARSAGFIGCSVGRMSSKRDVELVASFSRERGTPFVEVFAKARTCLTETCTC